MLNIPLALIWMAMWKRRYSIIKQNKNPDGGTEFEECMSRHDAKMANCSAAEICKLGPHTH